jgi:hypothetical protein
MIYIITDGTNYKIGYSGLPTSRLKWLQTGNSARLALIHIMKGGRRLESILHERYAIKRLVSEWFALTQEDLEEIKAWHCPTCGGGKHEDHIDPIDRLISEWFTTAQQAQAKLDEETVKAQARAWFRADPAEYVSEVYLPCN